MASGIYYQTSDYISDVRQLIHDPNAQDYTDAQLIPLINKSRDRVAEDCRCVRQFIAGLNTISQQEQYPLSGFTGGVAVTAGGTNYTAPVVTFNNTTAGGAGESASAVVTGGVIQQILMTNWGGGFTATPGVTITDPTGTGAAATAITGTTIMDLYQITGIWPGNTLAMSYNWLPFDAFQAFCRAYRANLGIPGAFSVHYGPVNPLSLTSDARRVFLYPIPNQAMVMEWDAITLPNALVANADIDYWVLRPWTDAVGYFAAHLCYVGTQQFAQADYWLARYTGRTAQLPATIRARRVHNYYRTYQALIRRMG